MRQSWPQSKANIGKKNLKNTDIEFSCKLYNDAQKGREQLFAYFLLICHLLGAKLDLKTKNK